MSRFVDVPDLARRQGLDLVAVLKEGYDHDVYLVDDHGMRRVLKTAVRPDLRRNLEREAAWATLLAALTAGPGWTVATTPCRAAGDGWLLRDHLDAGPLLREDALGDPGPLRRVALALADLDRLAPDPSGLRPAYRDAAGEPVADAAHRDAEVDRWADRVGQAGALGPREVGALRALLPHGRRDVLPGLELWDLGLDDPLDLPDGRVGLVDLEFAHLAGRRHHDAAEVYVELAVRQGSPDAAARLLGEYAGAVAQDRVALARSASPVLAEALLSALYDGVDAGDGDRVDRARRLLDTCLDGGLPGLLGAARVA